MTTHLLLQLPNLLFLSHPILFFFFFFFFNDTATTEIYTLSLHDALLIYALAGAGAVAGGALGGLLADAYGKRRIDRKSTRLNSSYANISYAVFCLKKKEHAPDAWRLALINGLPHGGGHPIRLL